MLKQQYNIAKKNKLKGVLLMERYKEVTMQEWDDLRESERRILKAGEYIKFVKIIKVEDLEFTFEGLTYTAQKNCLTIQVHTDINKNAFNCYSADEPINDSMQLKNEVIRIVANNKLWDEVYPDIEKITENTNDIINTIELQVSNREKYILANYSNVNLEGNILSIYDNKGNGFDVSINTGDLC